MNLVQQVEEKYKKKQVVDVRPGDNVKVHQKIREGEKERVQIFEGLVIRVDRKNSLSNRILVRRIASGVGVEKSFLLHSPLVLKVEVTKRSKVRRNYLSYMRERTGKSARMTGIEFDRDAVNAVVDEEAEKEEEKLKEEADKKHAEEDSKKAEEEKKLEEKVAAAQASHEEADKKADEKPEAKADKPAEAEKK